MKIVIVLLLVLTICVSCVSYDIKQKGYLTENNKRVAYKLNVPKNYLRENIFRAHGKAYEFFYENGALFYFSTEDFGWNYEEVSKGGKLIVGGPARDEINSADGIKDGKYWRKEEVKGLYWIGYQNISAERKKEFDKIINDFIFRYNGN